MASMFPRAVSQRMILVSVLTLSIGSAISVHVRSRYLAASELTDRIGDGGVLGNFLDKSLITCAAMCQEICTCFGHHVKDSRCRLHEQCLDASLTGSEVGWQYFRKVSGNTDCQTMHSEQGVMLSGVYTIRTKGYDDHSVYCDMTTEGGGWTVILKRTDGSVDFAKNWDAYKNGFGDASSEYWIGNEMIHHLTKQNLPAMLYVMITHVNGTTFYQIYHQFSVSSENDGYQLSIGETTGTLGDSIMPTGNLKQNLKGMMFSTAEKDQDRYDVGNCAKLYKGGWWFNACHYAFLTGPFGSDGWFKPWYPVFTHGHQIQAVIMMTKRK